MKKPTFNRMRKLNLLNFTKYLHNVNEVVPLVHGANEEFRHCSRSRGSVFKVTLS